MESATALSDEPLVNDGASFEVPTWFRWVAAVLALGLIVPPTIFIVRYSLAPARYVSPANLQQVARRRASRPLCFLTRLVRPRAPLPHRAKRESLARNFRATMTALSPQLQATEPHVDMQSLTP